MARPTSEERPSKVTKGAILRWNSLSNRNIIYKHIGNETVPCRCEAIEMTVSGSEPLYSLVFSNGSKLKFIKSRLTKDECFEIADKMLVDYDDIDEPFYSSLEKRVKRLESLIRHIK